MATALAIAAVPPAAAIASIHALVAADGATVLVLFHELGRALMDILDLPSHYSLFGSAGRR